MLAVLLVLGHFIKTIKCALELLNIHFIYLLIMTSLCIDYSTKPLHGVFCSSESQSALNVEETLGSVQHHVSLLTDKITVLASSESAVSYNKGLQNMTRNSAVAMAAQSDSNQHDVSYEVPLVSRVENTQMMHTEMKNDETVMSLPQRVEIKQEYIQHKETTGAFKINEVVVHPLPEVEIKQEYIQHKETTCVSSSNDKHLSNCITAVPKLPEVETTQDIPVTSEMVQIQELVQQQNAIIESNVASQKLLDFAKQTISPKSVTLDSHNTFAKSGKHKIASYESIITAGQHGISEIDGKFFNSQMLRQIVVNAGGDESDGNQGGNGLSKFAGDATKLDFDFGSHNIQLNQSQMNNSNNTPSHPQSNIDLESQSKQQQLDKYVIRQSEHKQNLSNVDFKNNMISFSSSDTEPISRQNSSDIPVVNHIIDPIKTSVNSYAIKSFRTPVSSLVMFNYSQPISTSLSSQPVVLISRPLSSTMTEPIGASLTSITAPISIPVSLSTQIGTPFASSFIDSPTQSYCSQTGNVANDQSRKLDDEVKEENEHMCSVCGETYKTYSKMIRHRKIHHDVKEYKCEKCGKQFALLQYLKNHTETHEGEKKLVCRVCKRRFLHRSTLINHEKTHTDEKPFVCSVCGRRFRRKAQLRNHIDMHEDTKPYNCTKCEKSFWTLACLKAHQKQHELKEMKIQYICDKCGKIFTNKSNFQRHTLIHSEETNHKCRVCGKGFKEKTYLRRHALIHSNQKPFVCEQCGKGFTHRTTLINHLKAHADLRPFVCDVCGKRFRRIANLQIHSRSHTGEAPYPCDTCGMAFSAAYTLRLHHRTHTGERPHMCGECGITFARPSTLRRHKKSHLTEKAHRCTTCGKSFAEFVRLQQHVRKHKK